MKQPLHLINPTVKAAAVFCCVVMLSFIYNPYTPACFYIIIIAGVLLVTGIPLKKWLLFTIPFLILAFGCVWTAAVFGKVPTTPDNFLFQAGLSPLTAIMCLSASPSGFVFYAFPPYR